MASTKKKRTTTRTKKTPASTLNSEQKAVTQEVAASVAEPKLPPAQISKPDLFRWNKWMACLYAVQALIIVVLGAKYLTPIDLNYGTDVPFGDGVVGASRHLFDANILWLTAMLLIVPALVHAVMVGMYRVRYEADLARSNSRLRWIGLGIGSVFTVAVTGIMSGLYSLAVLVLLATLTMFAHLLFSMHEQQNEDNSSVTWQSFALAVAALVTVVFVLASALIGNSVFGSGGISGVAYGLATAFTLWAAGTSLVTWAYTKRHNRIATYFAAERTYGALAVVTVSAVAWLTFIGVLQP